MIFAEDIAQQHLLRAALKKLGVQLNEIEAPPVVLGQNNDWVDRRLPVEVNFLRQANYLRAIIAVTDADDLTIEQRKAGMDRGVNPMRRDEEAIIYVVPRRNIETWIWYLMGNPVNETQNYKKKEGGPVRDDDYKLAEVKRRFVEYIQSGHVPFPDCPPSLQDAREKLRRAFPPN